MVGFQWQVLCSFNWLALVFTSQHVESGLTFFILLQGMAGLAPDFSFWKIKAQYSFPVILSITISPIYAIL